MGKEPSRRARALELALQGEVAKLESAGLGGSDHEPAELKPFQVGQLRAQLLVEGNAIASILLIPARESAHMRRARSPAVISGSSIGR